MYWLHAEQVQKAWFATVSKAQWHKPAAVKVQFGNGSILKNRRLVFNSKGNDCLVAATLAYDTGVVFVKFEPHAPCL